MNVLKKLRERVNEVLLYVVRSDGCSRRPIGAVAICISASSVIELKLLLSMSRKRFEYLTGRPPEQFRFFSSNPMVTSFSHRKSDHRARRRARVGQSSKAILYHCNDFIIQCTRNYRRSYG